MADRQTVLTVWLRLAGGMVRKVLGQTAIASFGIYTFHSCDPVVVVGLLVGVGNLARGMTVDPAAALLGLGPKSRSPSRPCWR